MLKLVFRMYVHLLLKLANINIVYIHLFTFIPLRHINVNIRPLICCLSVLQGMQRFCISFIECYVSLLSPHYGLNPTSHLVLVLREPAQQPEWFIIHTLMVYPALLRY